MKQPETVIRPVALRDLITITKMTFDNMAGVDRYFTILTRNPLRRLAHFIKMPIYLAFAGKGYKAVQGHDIVGCGFLYMRHISAYVFNVSVNSPYRRQGIGRQLMEELERIAWGEGKKWMVLQVDDGNGPAQKLYEHLGYRIYHPNFFSKQGRLSQVDNRDSDLAIEPMPAYKGEQLYRRYQRTEVQTGDPWAAPVLRDYDIVSGVKGSFWRCLLYGREIGCALVSASRGRRQVRLSCQPEYWGNETSPGLIKLLIDSEDEKTKEIAVYLGSSAHHQAAEPLFTKLGFTTKIQWRMLMFKALDIDWNS